MTKSTSETETMRLLDDPVRAALTSGNADVAQGGALALRYPREIGPFAAISDTTAASYDALLALIPTGDRIALVSTEVLSPPACFTIQRQAPILQMVLETLPAGIAPAEPEHVVLGVADVPDMLDLTGRTRPGPFGPRTIELGQYFGIRVGGALAAMAGERMRIGTFVEISGVCVDPAHRGKGYAAILMMRLARQMMAQAQTPILHVFADNASAIALYEKLGFRLRRTMQLTALARP